MSELEVPEMDEAVFTEDEEEYEDEEGCYSAFLLFKIY